MRCHRPMKLDTDCSYWSAQTVLLPQIWLALSRCHEWLHWQPVRSVVGEGKKILLLYTTISFYICICYLPRWADRRCPAWLSHSSIVCCVIEASVYNWIVLSISKRIWISYLETSIYSAYSSLELASSGLLFSWLPHYSKL